MINYQYSYLIGCLALLFIWLILFLWRKDTRKEMLIMSALIALLAFPANYVFSHDWWNPLTITGTLLGIEDFIIGFAGGGIASVVYEDVFKKKIKIRKKSKRVRKLELLLPFVLSLFLFFGSFFILNISSFLSSVIALGIPTLLIWVKRKDLILDSIFTGILLILVSFLFYWVPEIMAPGWVSSAWNWSNLSGVIILKQPLEDMVWWFLAGLFIGPLYEYWQEGRIANKK